MIRQFFAAAPAAVLLAAAPPALHAAPRDWSATVTATPAGAYVLGNPKAKVRLVEYLSLTCSHCAHFTTEALPVLRRDYIARGQVALEVRHAVRDGFDMAGSLLARCGGAPRYFATLERLFAAQPQWLEAGVRWQQQSPPDAAKGIAMLPAAARASGLDAIAARSGLSPARVQACLAAKPEIDRLAAMAQEAWNGQRITGTPFFMINGVPAAGTYDWAALKPQIDAALR